MNNDEINVKQPSELISRDSSFEHNKIDSIKVLDTSQIEALKRQRESYASLAEGAIFSMVTGFFPPDSTGNQDSIITKDSLNLENTKTDSIGVAADTIKVDSMALDSTARLKYFHYERSDLPYVTLGRHKTSPFFAQPTARQRTVRIDSTGKFVVIEEKTAGQETKILLRVPIEDYIEAKLALHRRELWEDLGYQYELKSSKKELGELIKNITDFEIPLPKVGVLSIFGEPKISLKIGGAVDIHGAWRNENTQGVTASRYGNTRNEPDFKQQVQITVNGTIGDKLHIDADWNTERTFQYENQLKIKYEGYEDEIIQSIEAGNVSLQTSPLVGGSEALFGLKANFKLGPLSLTTLASQKKGETEEVSVNSGSTSQEFNLRAYDYSTNHYFIDTVYASRTSKVFENYYNNSVPLVNNNLKVINIEVWKSVNVYTIDRTKYRQGNAFMDLPPVQQGQDYSEEYKKDTTAVSGKVETSWFELLQDGVDYVLHPETGYITFKTSLQEDDIIAVAYQQFGGNIYGEFLSTASDTSQHIVLKLVKPSNLRPEDTEAWSLLLKNIYPLGGRNIKQEGFEFNIEFEKEGQEPVTDLATPSGTVKLLNAFGLDLVDASGQPNPDNNFDWRPNLTIIPETGEVIFPVLEPFGRDLPGKIADSLRFQDIYDTSKTFAQQQKVKDKWLLTGKYSGEASSVYQLGFNIVENSVRVLLNGRQLTPGTDYIVDYNIGQVTIRNDAALVPGADLKITYEKNDLFQLASKTLLGARGVFDFSDRTKLGFSLLNLNQQSLSDKVRIGEEPLSNTIYGIDAQTGVDLPFVTKALDNIISTREMSSVNVSGEYAYMSPDPNTKKSTIASDQGQSIAYIDDFEGAKKEIPVGVSYTAWKDLSPPDSLSGLSGLTYRQMMNYKGKSIWYTVTPSDVNVKQIWPNKSVAQEDQQATVMDYVFIPDTPGTYNYYPHLSDPTRDWGGIMKPLSSTANNLVDENIEFVEFWARVAETSDSARLYLDLGRISEDVIPNDTLNTEDKPPYNDLIDNGEDVGLDGLTDAQERAKYNSTKSDPSGDNFGFTKTGSKEWQDYFNINGTQGNAILTDIGRFPDTEDLNKNGNLDRANSYFRYEIPLDTNKETNPYIAGGGNTNEHWHLYRVPLKNFFEKIGDPSLTDIESIRFIVTGASKVVHLRLTEFNLTGSQWQKVIPPDDSVMSISVVNLEDNPEYTLPPGVYQERDRTRPDQQIYRNEQSLNLIIKDLKDGESREAVKYLYQPLDVFNYKQMKLFVHGDTHVGPGSVTDTTGGAYGSDVYFRFGGDTNNFYEYRQPVTEGWNEISINFSELTAIKQARSDSSINKLVEKPVPGRAGHLYGVKGNPTLTSVKFLLVGIYNPRGSYTSPPGINRPGLAIPVSGEIWINELRVVGADDSPGWAYNLSGQIKLADLMNVNMTLSQTNPYFHKLSDRFGSRIESKSWGVSADVNILKLLPFSLPESNLRVNYSHNESIGKPLYLPGTDIKVDEAAKQIASLRSDTTVITTKTPAQIISESQTINTSDSWSASGIKIKIPTSAWYIRDTFNDLSFGFNYNKTFSRSPTVLANRGWVWNATLNYALNFNPNYYFEPVDIPVFGSVLALFTDYRNLKVYYTPQNFSFNATARRQRNTNITRSQTSSPSQEIISRDFGTTRGFNFSWKLTEGGLLNLATNYNVNITSSLAYLETGPNDQQRPENEIWHEIFAGAMFGKDYRYTQTFDLKTNPKLPSIWEINRYFQINAGYNVGYNWNFDFRQDTVGRSGGFASRLTAGLTLRLKALTDPFFEEKPETNVNQPNQNRGGNRGRDLENRRRRLEGGGNETPDTTKQGLNEEIEKPDSTQGKPKEHALTRALGFLKSVVHSLFFDYETISFNYTNDNSISKSGILGEGTGFNNFWGINYDFHRGPSRAFMLGLSSDVGNRAPNGNLQDVFSQKNSLDFRTSRPLWTGAKLDINWKVDWSVNKNTTITTDENGNPIIDNQNITETGTLERSFLSLPPTFFLSVFGNGIKKVNELFDPNSSNPQQNLSDAFVKGFETFPLLSKLSFLKNFSNYIPRPNWHFTWDGLENFMFFKSFTKKVSLENAYSSTYTEGTKVNPSTGVEEILTQRIDYGFSPLAGINITFNDMWGGNLIGSIKYGTKTAYDLGLTTKNISETFSKDIGITAGYSKSGFELPLFGISLKNDIEFSLSYTSSTNSVVRFDMLNFTDAGTPQDGTLRTTIEPRIKYTISSKVTLSIFYTRTSVEPQGAARIPPTTTNEAGLDVHISIQ